MDTLDLTRQFVSNIMNGQATDAQAQLQDIMAAKVTQALDAKKLEISTSLYGATEQQGSAE